MQLDLLIEWAAPVVAVAPMALARYPALERLLARGDPLAPSPVPLQQALLGLYAVHTEEATGHAALTLLGDGGRPGDDYWLRLDPVCLRPTRTHLVLMPLAPHDLSSEEAGELTVALAAHLSAAGYDIEVAHPQRWYVRARVAPQMHTVNPAQCAGVLREDHLPSGRDSAPWRRLITEAQMLLHDAPVNVAREAAGKLPANAIWPWGGGRLPGIGEAPYACVIADDPLALGLARATRAQTRGLPRNASEMLAQGLADGSNLVVLGNPGNDATTSLAALDREWFTPLTSALRAGAFDQLRLMLTAPERSFGRAIKRSDLRRWWRRARPLDTYA